jgi:glucosamine kinase
MKYIIGADGGGTKTAIIAADINGNIIAEAYTGGINYNFIGVDVAAANFITGIKKLGINSNDITAIAIGDPSTDDINEAPGTNAFISKVRKGLLLSETSMLYIKSDVFMTLYGLTAGDPGVLMISGTGAMGMAFDGNGGIFIAGGWGRITEDEGSGYYIAVNALKAALHYHDGIGENTLLYNAMIQYFRESDPRKLIYSFYEHPEIAPDIAPFSIIVSKCAASGDTQAINILNNTACYLSAYTISLLRQVKNNACKVGIYGSVLVNDNYIRKLFCDKIKSEYPEVNIAVPEIKPEYAAVLYAQNKLII